MAVYVGQVAPKDNKINVLSFGGVTILNKSLRRSIILLQEDYTFCKSIEWQLLLCLTSPIGGFRLFLLQVSKKLS